MKNGMKRPKKMPTTNKIDNTTCGNEPKNK